MTRRLPLLALALTLVCSALPVFALNNTMTPDNRVSIIHKASPAVVKITVDKILPAQQHLSEKHKKSKEERGVSIGSGVILNSSSGVIVTNAHVVSHQHAIVVTLKNGQRYRAQLIGSDTTHDLAVLKINAPHLVAMPVGSSAKLTVGDSVIAIGTPYGLTQTVTAGVISALHRPVNFSANQQSGAIQSYIQTDTPINPGNSGGALVNSAGELVGINTAIIAPSDGANVGLGFAIPSNVVRSIVTQLIQKGHVTQGLLGVVAQTMSPDLKAALHVTGEHGVVVTQIVPHSPAEKIKLQPEDVITAINGDPINSSVALQNAVGLHPPGSHITIDYIRNNQTQQQKATLTNAKTLMKQPLPHQQAFVSGVRLQNFSDLEEDGSRIKGIIILDLTETSDAALAGLVPGDVILSANHTPTPNIDALLSVTHKTPSLLLLKIKRAHNHLYMVLRKEPKDKLQKNKNTA